MNDFMIFIEQTLHGYQNGHQLLSKSFEITESTQQLMLRLSDLSGQNIQNNFNRYYTGYLLEETNKAVLSCTWYADEMNRPGCVWTHSLLIDVNDFEAISNNFEEIISLFHRPKDSCDFDYATTINFAPSLRNISSNLSTERLKYIVWSIWGNAKSVIIPNDNSKDYIYELTYLWFKYKKYLPHDFSFCTCSLGNRRINNKLFSLQIIPNNFVGAVCNHLKSECKILPSQREIKSFPMWVKQSSHILTDLYEEFDEFLCKLDSNKYSYEHFNFFIKLYLALNVEENHVDLVNGLIIIDKSMNEDYKSYYANKLISLYMNQVNIKFDATEVLLYLIETPLLKIHEKCLTEIIGLTYKQNKQQIGNIIKVLLKKDSYGKTEFILDNYAHIVSMDDLVLITNLDVSLCCVFVAFRFEYALCKEFWKQSEYFQKEILATLKDINGNCQHDCREIIKTILDTSALDLSKDIVDAFGEQCIDVFLEKLFSKNKFSSSIRVALINECKKHQKNCVKKIQNKFAYTEENISLIFVLILPKSKEVKNIVLYFWVNLFRNLQNTAYYIQNSLKIYWYYLTLILNYSEKFPLDIASEVFINVHNSMLNKKEVCSEWYGIEDLLPNVAFYNQWDKCKRIRKAIKQKCYKIKELENYDNELDVHLL